MDEDLLYRILIAAHGPVTPHQRKLISEWELERAREDLFGDDDTRTLSWDHVRYALLEYGHRRKKRWDTRRRDAILDFDHPLDIRTDEQKRQDGLRRKIGKLRETSGRTPAEIEAARTLAARLERKLS
jgi:hypothetical protein